MGAEKVFELLPPILRAVRDSGQPALWASDPMHANVFTTESGFKTRRFDAIMAEIEGFFAACRKEQVWPGGIHLEFTGEDVTECLGGSEAVLEEQLNVRYMTLCDPRLNARQSLDLAFRLAELQRVRSGSPGDTRRPCPAITRRQSPLAQAPPGFGRVRSAWARDAERAHPWDHVPRPIVGTGLIGASVGLAAKRAGVEHVAGYDADPEFLAVAAERGAVDEPVGSLVAAVEEAELVVVATPVATLRGADRRRARPPRATAPRSRTSARRSRRSAPPSPTASASSAAIPSAARRRAGRRAGASSSSRAPPGSSRRSPRPSPSATGCCTGSWPRSAPSPWRSTRWRTTACSRSRATCRTRSPTSSSTMRARCGSTGTSRWPPRAGPCGT